MKETKYRIISNKLVGIKPEIPWHIRFISTAAVTELADLFRRGYYCSFKIYILASLSGILAG